MDLYSPAYLRTLLAEVKGLIYSVEMAERGAHATLDQVADRYLASAVNMVHYLGLRAEDIRGLQQQLGQLGISRLGRAEAHVMASLVAVSKVLQKLAGEEEGEPLTPLLEIREGSQLLQKHTHSLLGERRSSGHAHIMVTVPTEAAHDPEWAKEMLEAGMTVARINCAHDHEAVWEQMMANLHAASRSLGLPIKICMDLGGPKLRTGPVKEEIRVRPGDMLTLTRDPVPGRGPKMDKDGKITRPAHVSCTLPEVFGRVKSEEVVKFNDGKIEGIVRIASADRLEVQITYAKAKGSRIRPDKGINFPESDLGISGLTQKDRQDLNFVAAHADIVNLSFVNSPQDVIELQKELEGKGDRTIGMILKIETRKGYTHLPQILLQAMQSHPIGVMIARGDLAVEVGWQDLAMVQAEIVRICEAAHIPVIWATQVLENLAKKGRPSRAEITDVAMAGHAEGVMLNKGPHIRDAIQMLGSILQNMQEYQAKSAPMLPRLETKPLDVVDQVSKV